jgi:hypothetical protein
LEAVGIEKEVVQLMPRLRLKVEVRIEKEVVQLMPMRLPLFLLLHPS